MCVSVLGKGSTGISNFDSEYTGRPLCVQGAQLKPTDGSAATLIPQCVNVDRFERIARRDDCLPLPLTSPLWTTFFAPLNPFGAGRNDPPSAIAEGSA